MKSGVKIMFRLLQSHKKFVYNSAFKKRNESKIFGSFLFYSTKIMRKKL